MELLSLGILDWFASVDLLGLELLFCAVMLQLLLLLPAGVLGAFEQHVVWQQGPSSVAFFVPFRRRRCTGAVSLLQPVFLHIATTTFKLW